MAGRIGSGEVQIWSIRLYAPEPAFKSYFAVLSVEEQNRAGRFKFEKLGRSYVLSRGGLRLFLGYYLGCRPGEIELVYGPKGKPALPGASRLRFNVSHSGDIALYAFALDCDLGIDVEQVRDLDGLESVAARFFSAGEVLELLSLSPGARGPAFFRCWTRKEAYIKAIGDGLSLPLDRFQVTLLPGEPARFVHIGNDPKAGQEWILHHIGLAPMYTGALAYPAPPRPIIIHPEMQAGELLEMVTRQLQPEVKWEQV
jgi:4'-phosphopantetheinyl transferase